MGWLKAAIVAALVVAVGWLFWSPPTFAVSATQSVSCRPLGWEMPGVASLYGYDSTVQGGSEAVDEALESLSGTADAEQQASFREAVEAGLLVACGDARENRMALLTVAVGTTLAVLILFRTRARPAPGEQSGPDGSRRSTD